ncbi:medium-chain acyl-CoA synthetase [Microlunatus phosphovorus NM-1]|uniref:Medium-chain acyl-CoA synthetase n=1 Tax=Microlunatus phosphovorus (strain ATCC 700054 / DSM 10555 / JCM 9379 / NBRC 101784 / NCIMB 13414 / VKM Ac-1990 / NM-1) TaxID=1032480 RepID=F5XEL7_MICPN|nr:AMP-binding protein [Microlunatus phosphovorus]BAK35233.1 medium-chain acyl-CoA synthetase [Microlunatus phosphovorus NM-1]
MAFNPHVRAARDFLLQHRDNYEIAYAGFSWPELPIYNFATDWFDGLAEENPDGIALWVIDGPDETKLTFAELAARSAAAAHLLAELGLRRGDRLLMVLGNCVPLWELMLAAIRLGAVIIPATPQLSAADLADRVERGEAKLLVAAGAEAERFAHLSLPLGKLAIGVTDEEPTPEDWIDYRRAYQYLGAGMHLPGCSRANDLTLLYFTSGTTALPKLVQHTQVSYPIGHLSTMYWMGLQPGDIHLNISSPGWAKHAWSNVFTPWLAGATVLVFNYARFDPQELLAVLERTGVTTFCAPPTVWRMLVQTDLAAATHSLREVLSAGEPLNPEVIDQVRTAWGLTIRDGYGQTETTAQVGNPPGAEVRSGSMGRPLPGYQVVLIDPATGEERPDEGELCLTLDPRPTPLMLGYAERAGVPDDALNATAFEGGVYHTGDVVRRDADGYLTFVGRADDVFKASDYRISPFELESVLIEHPAVAEAAVVPAPDPVRLAVPKAYVILAAGYAPDAETAKSILAYCREHLAPYKRIRRLEFSELPKTISGKIRRVELRRAEESRSGPGERPAGEFRLSDFEL